MVAFIFWSLLLLLVIAGIAYLTKLLLAAEPEEDKE